MHIKQKLSLKVHYGIDLSLCWFILSFWYFPSPKNTMHLCCIRRCITFFIINKFTLKHESIWNWHRERKVWQSLSLSAVIIAWNCTMYMHSILIYSQELHLQLENRNLFVLYRQEILAIFTYQKSLIGYPYNLDFNYGALAQLQHFSINNLGDPFIESNYGVHSRQFEVGVLDWFARLCELEKNEYWGYITNCGTEGYLHGILVGLVTINLSFLSF